MRNAITTTPRTGAFAGVRVSTNQDGAGLFTRLADGSWRQHTGTGQTPVFLPDATGRVAAASLPQ